MARRYDTNVRSMQRPTNAANALPYALTGDAGYLAVRLGYDAQRRFEAAVSELDLRPAEYDYLSTVAEFGPLSQRDVATILSVDASRVVALTDSMQARGIVDRSTDPADRRRNLISLTPTGTALVQKARRVAQRAEAELLAPLNDAERETLRTLLRRVARLDSAV
jgi:DNA-binding MarR family transcriptional regulator